MVACNCRGNLILGATKTVGFLLPEAAEAEALRWAANLAMSRGWNYIT